VLITLYVSVARQYDHQRWPYDPHIRDRMINQLVHSRADEASLRQKATSVKSLQSLRPESYAMVCFRVFLI